MTKSEKTACTEWSAAQSKGTNDKVRMPPRFLAVGFLNKASKAATFVI
jgi:hypothetical protein